MCGFFGSATFQISGDLAVPVEKARYLPLGWKLRSPTASSAVMVPSSVGDGCAWTAGAGDAGADVPRAVMGAAGRPVLPPAASGSAPGVDDGFELPDSAHAATPIPPSTAAPPATDRPMSKPRRLGAGAPDCQFCTTFGGTPGMR
jgi:hypothetical protein